MMAPAVCTLELMKSNPTCRFALGGLQLIASSAASLAATSSVHAPV
jgi:hypothetical protein